MEINQFRHTVSSIFSSSFASCQFRTQQDAIEPSFNKSKTSQNRHENELSFKKPPKNELKNPKKTLFLGSGTHGRRCPPVTPVSGLNVKGKDKESSKKFINHSSSSNSGWFSEEKTEADAETNKFFSLSSTGSCESFTKSSRRIDNTVLTDQCSQKTTKNNCKTVQNPVKSAPKGQKTSKKSRVVPVVGFEVSDISTEIYYSDSRKYQQKTSPKMRKTNPRRRTTNSFRLEEDWTEESYAMEKISKDPRSDFMASMVEMIVEKQIFGGNDLEKLLHCFLSLNEVFYHGIIFDVFNEICETLFSN
ncbi:Hypothetical predicted protein [Olea europaea subsp. europaea]|uniref:Transcription repressor n=1 Tax=Olea europaea subsp. europaea TaxID=158383 RepID=A0A8S0QBP3_OLEEU|nr:Hypothetical predicted protein [Olea europaea subsp. europaea]